MSQINPLREGTIVQLKSGGPLMTVAWIDSEYRTTHCNWFDEEGELKSYSFMPEQLKVVPHDF